MTVHAGLNEKTSVELKESGTPDGLLLDLDDPEEERYFRVLVTDRSFCAGQANELSPCTQQHTRLSDCAHWVVPRCLAASVSTTVLPAMSSA